MNILYLISLPLIIYKFLHIPNNINNFDINEIAKHCLYKENFNNITTPRHFINYLEKLLKSLYQPNGIPTFIPVGAVRLKRFSINNNCNLRCTYNDPLDIESSVCELASNITISQCSKFYSYDNELKNSSYYRNEINHTFYDNVLYFNSVYLYIYRKIFIIQFIWFW